MPSERRDHFWLWRRRPRLEKDLGIYDGRPICPILLQDLRCRLDYLFGEHCSYGSKDVLEFLVLCRFIGDGGY